MHAMPETRGDALFCPNCRYDLAFTQGDGGQCPECGREFSKAAIRRTALAVNCLALGMVAIGTLASLPFELNSVIIEPYIGVSHEVPLPDHTQVAFGSIPPVIAAAGIILLGYRSAGGRWYRYGIVGMAATFAACVLFVLSSYFHPYPPIYITGWMSPHRLIAGVIWITPLLAGLTLIAATVAVAGVARPVLGVGMIQVMRVVLAITVAGTLAATANRAHSLMVVRDDTLTDAWKLWGTIDAGSALVADWLLRLCCLLVGMGALIALAAMRTASEPARSNNEAGN